MFSHTNRLFHHSNNVSEINDFQLGILKNKHYKSLFSTVKKEGLQGVYKNLEKFNFGKDIFLSETDWLYLASLDENITPENSTLEQPYHFSQPFSKLLSDHSVKKHREVKEKNGEGMEYVTNIPFSSWEGTIHNKPEIIFMPKTVVGLQHLVHWANQQNKKIRAAGFHHSSSNMYGDDNQILISTLNLKTATRLPTQFPRMDPNNEMQGIQLIGCPYVKEGKIKIKCKIGSATCNYHMQDWVHDARCGNWQWTLPLNVILTEITFGGSISNACHGAGITNKTISDLAKEIEFVNVRGQLQKVSDEKLIKAAAACFGLLGPLVSLTLELDKMTYANLKTVKKKLLALTVPPPNIPLSSQLKNNLTEKNLKALRSVKLQQQALQDFIDNCENRYYAEFFWFPLQEKGWINCWDNNGRKEKAKRYPKAIEGKIQSAGAYLAHLATNFNDNKQTPLLRKIQTKLMGDLAMFTLPHKSNTVCSMEDALHFRKGIHNIPTRMMEIEIPIPDSTGTNKPDWSICQQAWWAVIESVYSEENLTYFPMRTTLEMRIMNGSEVTMASQYGNKRTCAIEVLTPTGVNAERWEHFLQEILDKWAMLKDDKGQYINIRPHWAKKFDNLKINRDKTWQNQWSYEQKCLLSQYVKEDSDIISVPMIPYLKHIAYKEQIKNFIAQLTSICEAGGYHYHDIRERFSNSLLNDLLPNQTEKPQLELIKPYTLFGSVENKSVSTAIHNKLHL